MLRGLCCPDVAGASVPAEAPASARRETNRTALAPGPAASVAPKRAVAHAPVAAVKRPLSPAASPAAAKSGCAAPGPTSTAASVITGRGAAQALGPNASWRFTTLLAQPPAAAATAAGSPGHGRGSSGESGTLFFVTAKIGTLTMMGGRNGSLILEGVAPWGTWFDDKPIRRAGTLTSNQLFSSYDFFQNGEPAILHLHYIFRTLHI